MNTSTKAYRINVKAPAYAEVLTDTAGGTTYGTVKSLGEAQTANMTATIATGTLYGDGDIVDSSSKLTGMSLQLDLTKIPIEAKADIYNYTVTDGVIQVSAGVTAKYIAVGYEVEQTNGQSEYVWLLKGRPQPMSHNAAQSEGNINYSTDTLNINFVKRISDGKLQFFADLSNPDFTDEQAAAWFLTGPSSPVPKSTSETS